MSRLTFRSATETCYQRQRRDEYAGQPAPLGVDAIPLSAAMVRPVSYAIAKQVILKYEWLGKMSSGVNRHYGIFFGMFCAGVTSWGPAGYNLPRLLKTFDLANDELGYLARGACVHWAPTGTNSKLVAHSLRFERKRGTKMAIAFADTDAGEIGTIYQAANWTYVGKGAEWPQYAHPNGAVRSYNQVTLDAKKRGIDAAAIRKMLLDRGWTKQTANAKHRYVYVLADDVDLRARVDSMREPYPKRATRATADSLGAAADHYRPARSTIDG